jgi:hypothetical protein
MTPEQLEEGHRRARGEFAAWGSVFRRSFGLPGALKRIAYNVAWMKIDPLWVAIIRSGLMPFATRIFQRILSLPTETPREQCATVLRPKIGLSPSCPPNRDCLDRLAQSAQRTNVH